jgi:hypothetical protein
MSHAVVRLWLFEAVAGRHRELNLLEEIGEVEKNSVGKQRVGAVKSFSFTHSWIEACFGHRAEYFLDLVVTNMSWTL